MTFAVERDSGLLLDFVKLSSSEALPLQKLAVFKKGLIGWD